MSSARRDPDPARCPCRIAQRFVSGKLRYLGLANTMRDACLIHDKKLIEMLGPAEARKKASACLPAVCLLATAAADDCCGAIPAGLLRSAATGARTPRVPLCAGPELGPAREDP